MCCRRHVKIPEPSAEVLERFKSFDARDAICYGLRTASDIAQRVEHDPEALRLLSQLRAALNAAAENFKLAGPDGKCPYCGHPPNSSTCQQSHP